MVPARAKEVQVKIFGQTYTLTGEDDPDVLREIAAFVDSRMQEVANQLSTITLSRVAILASLNIASELFAIQGQVEQVKRSVHSISQELIQLIDQQITKHANRDLVDKNNASCKKNQPNHPTLNDS